MNETLKQLSDMIEDDGHIVYKNCMLFKSSNEDQGFTVGKMTNHKMFEPDRAFGYDLAGAIRYLFEMEIE